MIKPVKRTKSATSRPAELRRQAEKIAREKADRSPKKHEAFSPEETLRIIHELQVHQIELQMQNEEMSRAQAELDAARARYFDLYDLAPIGYCTISDHGLIMEANLTAAALLNLARERLVGQLLNRFILKEDQDIYYLHNKQLWDTCEPQTCELRMVKKNGTSFWAHLIATMAKEEGGATVCRVVMSDITERKQVEAQREEALEALRKSETQLRATLEAVADGILAVDNKGKVVQANRRFADLWRIPQSLTDRSDDGALLDFVLNQLIDPDSFLKKVQSLYDSDTEDIDKITFKDGRFFERYSLPMIMDGIRIGRVWSFRDITQRKQMEKKLKNSEEKFRMLAESSAFAIMMYQGDRWIYANRAAEEISGYTEEELYSMHFWDFVHPDYRDMIKERAVDRHQGKMIPRSYEFKIIAKNGAEKWVSLSGNRIQYEDKPTALISVTDISERKIVEAALKESEQRYRDLSIIDDLTQLYNSRHFYAQLEREIERSNRYGHPLTLLLLDIDKFKDFNDTYGHVQGDYVLSRLGHAIKRSLREIDSAYRYGGEEFTIILPMTMSEEGIVTAKRIQKELRKENFSLVSGQEVYVTVSIGLAQYKSKEEIKAFVLRVDQFMYKVKKNGRGKICSDDGDLQ
jgi:diguanylate cyclase (GGDEF)-like protein/PAS domain S-box-containing protein